MGVEKVSMSFDLELGEAIRVSAGHAHQSVSSWLAGAARDLLRLQALGEAVASWEDEHSPLTETEVAAAERLLPGPAKKRRRGAA